MKRALITNDDGIKSPGLSLLAQMAVGAGFEVQVAAPAGERSGASGSLFAVLEEDHLQVVQHALPGAEDIPALAVDATPAFIVFAAIHGAFGPKPDVVLTGINMGPNTGHAILHSGTVGAALTASTFATPGVAFSLNVRANAPHLDTAGVVARKVLDWLIGTRPAAAINVNIPDIPLERLRGIEAADLAAFGAVTMAAKDAGGGRLKITYNEVEGTQEPGTDATLLQAGYATVTALHAVCKADEPTMKDLVATLQAAPA